MDAQQAPGVYVLLDTLGATIKATAEVLKHSHLKAHPATLLYAEKAGGFQCRTCIFAVAQNATHGRCSIMQGTISLDEGCCAAWSANLSMLQLHKEF